MPTTLHLELYQGAIPAPFASLPGAQNYESGKANLYWGVLIPAPLPGSSAAGYIAPVGPDDQVGATTLGTETLPVGAGELITTGLCIWSPKTPPYSFKVVSPQGSVFELNPPNGSTDEQAWHCVSVPSEPGIGIWTMEVDAPHGPGALPTSFGGRNARLNPDFLDFTPALFQQQPLLRVEGRDEDEGQECAELGPIEVVGCAPGVVGLSVNLATPGEVNELTWGFGDDSPAQSFTGAGIPGGLSVQHVYGTPGPHIVVVTVLRLGCQPMVAVESAMVPACPDPTNCGEPDSVEVSGCAPGPVTFTAQVTGAGTAQEISWDFGDGTTQAFGPGAIAQGEGMTVQHTYAAPGPFTAVVTVVRAPGCSPLAATLPASVDTCPDHHRPCPRLRALEVRDGCAPGTVTLQVTGEDLEQAEGLIWEFGDGPTASFTPGQLAAGQGLVVEHTYGDGGPFTATVIVMRGDHCRPGSRSISVEIPECRTVECPDLRDLTVSGCRSEREGPVTLTLEARGDNLGSAVRYEWDFGDGSTGVTTEPTTTHDYASDGPFDISVVMAAAAGCNPPWQREEVNGFTVPGCRPPREEVESCLCTILRILGLALFIGGLVLIFGSACSGNIPGLVVGLGLALTGAAVLIAWALTCGQAAGCSIFQSVLAILYLLTVILGFLAVIFGILAIFEIGVPCLLGALIDLAIVGTVSTILTWIFLGMGCQWQVGETFPV